MQGPDSTPDNSPAGGFNPFPDNNSPEDKFPVRDMNNVKLQAADLFSLFTADIIKEDTQFTR